MALQRLGHEAVISADPDIIRRADRVIIPGVGEASSAMRLSQGEEPRHPHHLTETACPGHLPRAAAHVQLLGGEQY
ncbi:MAG: hypothetical protein MZV63_50640 [Marinilabiliales bacterium]|nr:hypothetical protein [Marinilabiliales bacterium]